MLVSGNGPQIVATEMEQFLEKLAIQNVKASPRYPQSNGMVERLHRIVRERLRKLRPSIPFACRLQQVLMDIKNSANRMLESTPGEDLFGRILNTRVPSYSSVIVNPAHQIRTKARVAEDHDAKRGVHPLPKLTTGTVVVLQDECSDPSKQWRVVEQYGQQIGVSDGRSILLRNRRHVREFHALMSTAEQHVPATASPAAISEPCTRRNMDIRDTAPPAATLSLASDSTPSMPQVSTTPTLSPEGTSSRPVAKSETLTNCEKGSSTTDSAWAQPASLSLQGRNSN